MPTFLEVLGGIGIQRSGKSTHGRDTRKEGASQIFATVDHLVQCKGRHSGRWGRERGLAHETAKVNLLYGESPEFQALAPNEGMSSIPDTRERKRLDLVLQDANVRCSVCSSEGPRLCGSA